jgi:hypothetical protein
MSEEVDLARPRIEEAARDLTSCALPPRESI